MALRRVEIKEHCGRFFAEARQSGAVPGHLAQYKSLETCENFTRAWTPSYGSDVCISARMPVGMAYWVSENRRLVTVYRIG